MLTFGPGRAEYVLLNTIDIDIKISTILSFCAHPSLDVDLNWQVRLKSAILVMHPLTVMRSRQGLAFVGFVTDLMVARVHMAALAHDCIGK